MITSRELLASLQLSLEKYLLLRHAVSLQLWAVLAFITRNPANTKSTKTYVVASLTDNHLIYTTHVPWFMCKSPAHNPNKKDTIKVENTHMAIKSYFKKARSDTGEE